MFSRYPFVRIIFTHFIDEFHRLFPTVRKHFLNASPLLRREIKVYTPCFATMIKHWIEDGIPKPNSNSFSGYLTSTFIRTRRLCWLCETNKTKFAWFACSLLDRYYNSSSMSRCSMCIVNHRLWLQKLILRVWYVSILVKKI